MLFLYTIVFDVWFTWRVLLQYLAENWSRLKTCRRTIIHIPSLGYLANLRRHVDDFDIVQSRQMSRLCDVRGTIKLKLDKFFIGKPSRNYYISSNCLQRCVIVFLMPECQRACFKLSLNIPLIKYFLFIVTLDVRLR